MPFCSNLCRVPPFLEMGLNRCTSSPPLRAPPAFGTADLRPSWAGPARGHLGHAPTSSQGCRPSVHQLLGAGSPREEGKHGMHAVCSWEGRHTQRPDCLPSLLLPDKSTHAHKTGYVHKPPHAGAEGPDPRQGKRRERHVPEGESRRRGRAEGGRQQTRWPDSETITKMGSEIFKDAAAAPSTGLWPGCICLPRHAWSPGAPWPSPKG